MARERQCCLAADLPALSVVPAKICRSMRPHALPGHDCAVMGLVKPADRIHLSLCSLRVPAARQSLAAQGRARPPAGHLLPPAPPSAPQVPLADPWCLSTMDAAKPGVSSSLPVGLLGGRAGAMAALQVPEGAPAPCRPLPLSSTICRTAPQPLHCLPAGSHLPISTATVLTVCDHSVAATAGARSPPPSVASATPTPRRTPLTRPTAASAARTGASAAPSSRSLGYQSSLQQEVQQKLSSNCSKPFSAILCMLQLVSLRDTHVMPSRRRHAATHPASAASASASAYYRGLCKPCTDPRT